MSRITDIYLLSRPAQFALSIRTRTRVQDLPALIGRSYGAMATYLAKHDGHLADVPFVCYHNMDRQDLDVEMGFPLPSALPGKGEIQTITIPAQNVVSCMYLGPYHAMEPVYAEMAAWITEKGLTPSGLAYEYYYNGPECPEEKLLTSIMMPLK